MNLRETILSLVDSAMRGTELITTIAFDFYESGLSGELNTDEILETLEELVAEGELVEIEYTTPASAYRVRSIYFPKGTEIVRRASRTNFDDR